MATRKNTKKTTAAKNSKAAKQRTAKASKTRSAARPDPASVQGSDVNTFGTADTETQKAASVAAAVQVGMDQPLLAPSLGRRVSAIEQAMAERDRVLRQAEADRQRAEATATASVAGVMTQLDSAPKAPIDNPLQKPLAREGTGIHPDVTSPTNLMASEEPRLPGTGVADPRDLAPGQDMSPSPPVSSSNIVPTPLKDGTPFSRL